MDNPKVYNNKTRYQLVRHELERFIDSFPEAIYLKHYNVQKNLKLLLSNLQDTSSASYTSSSSQKPITKEGRIAIYNRIFAEGLIQRIIRKDPKINLLGLEKTLVQLKIINEDGSIDLANEKLDKFRRKVNYLTDFDIFSDDFANEFLKDDLEVVLKNKIIWDRFEQYKFPDAYTHSVSTTKVPWLNENGKIIGVMGMSRDITGRVEFMYQLCDEFPGCAFVVIQNRWVYVNKLGVKMLGFETTSDLLNKEFSLILKDGKQYSRLLNKIKKEGCVKNHLLHIKHPNSPDILHAEITASRRFDEHGQFSGFHGVIIAQGWEIREKQRRKELHDRISDLKVRTLKDLNKIFNTYLEDKALSNAEEIDRMTGIAREVYYWIIRDKLRDRQIAERFMKQNRYLTASEALKKAQNYTQIIRRDLKIKGKGKRGIIEYAQQHGHI